jgi:hypothetical protein
MKLKRDHFLRTSIGIFLAGCFLGTLAPSPVDPIYFYLENYVVPHTTGLGKILLEIFNWYILDSLYYLLLMGLAYVLHIKKVSIAKKITVIGGIAGLGIVIGILTRVLWK